MEVPMQKEYSENDQKEDELRRKSLSFDALFEKNLPMKNLVQGKEN